MTTSREIPMVSFGSDVSGSIGASQACAGVDNRRNDGKCTMASLFWHRKGRDRRSFTNVHLDLSEIRIRSRGGRSAEGVELVGFGPLFGVEFACEDDFWNSRDGGDPSSLV